MNNQEKAKFIIGKLLNYGVKEFCVCAGARNTPLLQALSEEHQAHVKSFFNENSAAFYSIGRIKKTGHPSAVITTSGSAVAELLPAVMEAYFLNYPLIVVTADRPVEFRGSGAPQTVDQQHIFNSHCMKSYDLVNDDFEELNQEDL